MNDTINRFSLILEQIYKYYSKFLLWGIVGFGILLRLVQYLSNRSLWLDEARLALNIVGRSFSELWQPLTYNQGAPIGFLMAVKLSVQIFGNNEYVLRLVPFLCGIVSLFLFYKIAPLYLDTRATPIAVGLFAISEPLIYYSSEVKQYSCDVAMGLLILLTASHLKTRPLTSSRIALFGLLGGIAIWLSHPATFMLAGVGTTLGLFSLIRRDWSRTWRLLTVGSIWISSFVVYYLVSLSELSHNEKLLNYWADCFLPFPPTTFSDAAWIPVAFLKFIKFIFDIPVPGSVDTSLLINGPDLPMTTFLSAIAAFGFSVALILVPASLSAIGCFSMFSKEKENLLLLLTPLFFASIASSFRLYPLFGRLMLFFLPVLLLLIAKGLVQIVRRPTPATTMLTIVLLVFLFSHPLLSASRHLVKPRMCQEIKPVVSYVRKYWREGDLLYIHHGSVPAFEYYCKKYGFVKTDWTIGQYHKNDLTGYEEDLNKLSDSSRIWFLFSQIMWNGVNEEEVFRNFLDTLGTELDSCRGHGAAVYLYEFREKNAET